jgi:Holliday junction resolvase RusA-like endonuclease
MGLPKSTNQLHGKHWAVRAKEKKHWLTYIGLMVGANKPKEPLKKAKITYIRHSSKEMDFDNLYGSLKVPLDCLKQLKIIEDDRPSVIGLPEAKQSTTGPSNGYIELIVEEL